MLRMITAAAVAVSLAGCMQDAAVKTFADATGDVNEGFAHGKRLRDRCASTNDVTHCNEWLTYKRAEETANPLLDYDKGLARWETNGPY